MNKVFRRQHCPAYPPDPNFFPHGGKIRSSKSITKTTTTRKNTKTITRKSTIITKITRTINGDGDANRKFIFYKENICDIFLWVVNQTTYIFFNCLGGMKKRVMIISVIYIENTVNRLHHS